MLISSCSKAGLRVGRSLAWALTLAWSLTACGGGGGSGNADVSKLPGGPSAEIQLSAAAQLGQKIFHDPSLSASQRQSCASCHVAEFGHAQSNNLATQLGGPALDVQGSRLSPSIRYLATNQAFHFANDGTPTGGFFWDGRASSLQAQAEQPFLNPAEMANRSKDEVIERLASATYAAEFRQLYGNTIFSDTETAFQRLSLALQQYQLEAPEFRPFSSKYDAFLLGKLPRLSEQEMRGLALYNNPEKANCLACHPSARGADGSLPLFTDFTYDNLGIPRNSQLKHNDDPDYFDLGLCARANGDLEQRKDLCGLFKVPSLRNVALRKAFFHNGRFKTLEDAVSFYVQRDTNPEKWYPRNEDGSVRKFDDLPPDLHKNVNVSEVPYNRKPGEAPALSDEEIADLVAFLHTLTDGYQP